MKTLNPFILNHSLHRILHIVSFIFITILFTSNVSAQQGMYASLTGMDTKKEKTERLDDLYSHASGKVNIIDPVVKVRVTSAKSVTLSWKAFKRVSHYVLERSQDGMKFRESAVFFTEDGQTQPEFIYSDKIKSAYSGSLYYRLRVVGLDGSITYTPYTILSAE